MDDIRSNIAHLYRRAGFGARPAELDAAVARGYQATVDDLIAGLNGSDAGGDRVAPPSFTPVQPLASPAGQDAAAKMAANRQRQMEQNQQYQALQTWWLDRMIATSTPLREKLTLLWHGHFATGFEKVRNAGYMYRQNQLLRTMGAGAFDALTLAVAEDPAMMVWLDTQTDVAAHPNENFARELMELFTLGIGNYSEADVKDGARCFTGWAFSRLTGAYVFRPAVHDAGSKTVLGQTGPWNGDDMIRIVTHSPASARWIVAKLWSHLAYPVSTSDPIVADLARSYGADLNIAHLLRSIFLRPEFTSDAARGGLVKQPIEYVVGVARAFGLDAAGRPASGGSPSSTPTSTSATGGAAARRSATAPVALPRMLTLLAQEPFNPPNVGGWPQNEYWLNTATAQARLQYGYAVGRSADLSALTAVAPGQRVAALAHLLSIDGWGPTTAAALNHVASDPLALVAVALSAPEYVLN